MRAPMERVAAERFWPWFWRLLAANAGIAVALMVAGKTLKTDAAPDGIFTLYFAGSEEAAGAVLDSWDPRARVDAAFSLGLDYLYMVLYAAGIALLGSRLALSARARGMAGPAVLGAVAGWLGWAGAGFDAVENAAILEMLTGGAESPWPAVTYAAALVKFGLLTVALLSLLVGVLILRPWRKTATTA
jgi:hypothetical protein